MESSNDANTEFRDTETSDVYLSCGRPLQVTRQDGTVVCLSLIHIFRTGWHTSPPDTRLRRS